MRNKLILLLALAFIYGCFSDDCGLEGGTVTIGSQIWTAKNLNCKVNGSVCYDNQESNCQKYGRLYSWATAMALPPKCDTIYTSNAECAIKTPYHQGICPAGWHIPSNADSRALVKFVGANFGIGNVGGALKAVNGWDSDKGDDKYGFSVLPGGSGSPGGYFSGIGSDAGLWKASENADYLSFAGGPFLGTGSRSKTDLLSVRCVKDGDMLLPAVAVVSCPNAVATPTNAKGIGTLNCGGQTYKTVKIGTQIWMAQNLNYNANGSKCYGEGGMVNGVQESYPGVAGEIKADCAKYGRLYDWTTAMGVCPRGWHLPSNAEWDRLYRFADGTQGTKSPYSSPTAGRNLKTKTGWSSYTGNEENPEPINANGLDKFGFSALPGGSGRADGDYDWYGGKYQESYWWSTSEVGGKAYARKIPIEAVALWDNVDKSRLLSVRCIKD